MTAANLLKWDDFAAMRNYLEGDYVYWSTPAFRKEISVGDPAYMWLSDGGIIAIGEVAEAPREYDGRNRHLFAQRDRLEAPGWHEDNAVSPWKTGISLIGDRFWERPRRTDTNLFTHGSPEKTIYQLDENQHNSIIRAIGET